MARHTEGSILRLGSISLVVLLVVMAAAFNLQKFPGFRGHRLPRRSSPTRAACTTATWCRSPASASAGSTRCTSTATTSPSTSTSRAPSMGEQTQASVQVLNLLGEKYLEIDPQGSGEMKGGSTIPESRTYGGYDIVSTLSELTTRTEADQHPAALAGADHARRHPQRGQPARAVAPSPACRASPRRSPRRDESIQQLLGHADRVTKLLAERRGDLVTLMKQGDLVFKELIARRDAIHALLVNADRLAVNLRGLATDNQAQIKDALKQLDTALTFLRGRETAARRGPEEPRALRLDPDQHHRHRTLVRRLRPQRRRLRCVQVGEEAELPMSRTDQVRRPARHRDAAWWPPSWPSPTSRTPATSRRTSRVP